ncbi:MAG: NFACT RNA binding domain-containing protein [Candidatus Cloacimonadales bacterium]|nr:NFACT RNA binding domain-containing protein [Candidatus Cloacimonadales bacterium]
MQYGFLKKWVQENSEQNLIFQRLEKFEDQYRIVFKKQKKSLHISLSSLDCFCFFSDLEMLSFADKKELNQFNQNLNGARLQAVNMVESDRIIFLEFSAVDIYNQQNNFRLILELIPRYQNIILLKDDTIIDSIKKISFAQNRHRQILPGIKYEQPPTEFEAKEIAILYPITVTENRKIIHSEKDGFSDINSVFEKLFEKIRQERNERIRQSKISQISKKIKQKERKLDKLQAELKQASEVENLIQQAELLKANFSKLKTGMKSIKVANYYKADFPEIEIGLDAGKPAKQNIESYFKKYRKARDGKVKISEQIAITSREIDDLEKEIFEIEESDFLLENDVQKHKKETSQPENYKKLRIDENWEIFIGRTSKENDLLTTKMAKPQDWWFHTRIYRGTHVILRNPAKKELPEELKILCCRLAAYYSKAKKSTNVPVDFTQIRFVRKPRGTAAGFVTYKNQKTLYVDPLSMRDASELIVNIIASK